MEREICATKDGGRGLRFNELTLRAWLTASSCAATLDLQREVPISFLEVEIMAQHVYTTCPGSHS